ncbi:hypothetical protein [Nitriliruptor alkaliphilus]|uniref:hypothetical protein n=1 Tax=Nitriliruptor alkaliphilus TaxID=427918 RepID=UPI00069674AB|nr:hypothetical protein [Nitriliruptor alkaliphilus]
MSKKSDQVADQVGAAVASALRKKLSAHDDWVKFHDLPSLSTKIVAAASDAAVSEAAACLAGGPPIAQRIGPIYLVADLTRWLPSPGTPPLSDEAVRKRIRQRQLVAFRTDDLMWAFPGWQFDRIGGQLVPRASVIELWKRLPTRGFLTDVDLAVWMATRLRILDGTPADHAHTHGADSPPLQRALSRLNARAA